MRCRFCFATFQDVRTEVLPRGHLAEAECLEVVRRLCAAGIRKLTFAGGEPTLCPWLDRLAAEARRAGVTTMLVSNGSRLLLPEVRSRLVPHFDWITLSIDSAEPATQERIGRSLKGRAIATQDYLALAAALRIAGVRLKMNTVVCAENVGEDLSNFVARLRPERWKMLQALPVAGQNDGAIEALRIDATAFGAFCARHAGLAAQGITLVHEDEDAMTGSYAMVDPAGRFFDNTTGRHRYSSSILKAGVPDAFAEIRFRPQVFLARGGLYQWE